MASEAQLGANRRNAQKSTGPRTEEGRAVASRNALRHGLTAERVVVFDEEPEDLARFRDEVHAALDPADEMEGQLAERIVLCAWRLRRACRVEAGLINARAEEISRGGFEPKVGSAFRNAAQGLAMVSRYESALDRSLRRAYAMLERRQSRRRGESVLPPITVEIDGLDAVEGGPPQKLRNEPNSAAGGCLIEAPCGLPAI
jgi:hypothetical protein